MTALRRSRLLKEITLFELSRRSKISMSRLSYFERGMMEPKEKEKKRLSRVFKVSVAELFGEGGAG